MSVLFTNNLNLCPDTLEFLLVLKYTLCFLFCFFTGIISILQVSAQIPLNSSTNICYVLTLGPGTADTDPERVLILMQLTLIIWRRNAEQIRHRM